PSFTAWLFNGLSLDNQLITHEGVKSRIMFEDTPYGSQYLSVIVEAMSTNHVLAMSYRSYNRPEETEWLIEPRGLKQYRRRWYLIGNKYGEDTPLTFALDRIESLEISDKIFDSDNGENLNELFSEVVGVFVDPDLDVEDITVRVYGKQRNYFEGTPLHHSQRVIERHTEYTDYGFCLRPEYEFQHEILRLGPGAEVLSPQWLRNDMVWYANRILERYKS
ncbi:MAG: WYL domain-containing protein, partial [Bacteroides sp.]|nr:WYL domain-containing protein [Bacteroides sp.]